MLGILCCENIFQLGAGSLFHWFIERGYVCKLFFSCFIGVDWVRWIKSRTQRVSLSTSIACVRDEAEGRGAWWKGLYYFFFRKGKPGNNKHNYWLHACWNNISQWWMKGEEKEAEGWMKPPPGGSTIPNPGSMVQCGRDAKLQTSVLWSWGAKQSIYEIKKERERDIATGIETGGKKTGRNRRKLAYFLGPISLANKIWGPRKAVPRRYRTFSAWKSGTGNRQLRSTGFLPQLTGS